MRIEDKYQIFCSDDSFKNIVYVDSDFVKNTRFFDKNVIFEDSSSLQSPHVDSTKPMFIGAYSYMNPGGYIRGECFIGRFCSIGRRVSIGAGAHSLAGLSTSPFLKIRFREISKYVIKRDVKSSRTVIGNDVWIGDGAVILSGVNVGTGAVIGANAVVTRDVGPYEIVVGVPASRLRKRLPESFLCAFLESEWWNYDLSLINSLNATSVEDFLSKIASLNRSFVDYSSHSVKCP